MKISTDMTQEDAFGQELFELITRYEDDALDDAGLTRLNELLIGSAEARDAFNDVCLQSLSISEALAVEGVVLPQEAIQSTGGNKIIPFPRWLGAAAAVFVALFATVYYLIQSGAPALDLAEKDASEVTSVEPLAVHLQTHSGVVEIFEANGKAIEITDSRLLTPGVTVATSGPDSSTVLVYPDGTRIELGPDSSISFLEENRKLVLLKRGQLLSKVQPQPTDQPFGVRTPHLELTVVGTEFLVTADDDDSSVRVIEGHVQVERLSDQGEVELIAQQEITVAPEGELLVASLPPFSPESTAPNLDGSSTPRGSSQPPAINLRVGEGPVIRGVVTLGDPAVLNGRALDAQGRPLANASVSIHADANTRKALAEATTDSQGRFEVKVFIAGDLVIRVGSSIETKVVATSGQVSNLGDLSPDAK